MHGRWNRSDSLSGFLLPELVAETPEAYEAVATELATHPEKSAAIRDELGRNRGTEALFDTERFTRHVEAAYIRDAPPLSSRQATRPYPCEAAGGGLRGPGGLGHGWISSAQR